ncbi:mCG1044084, partial [Mus musculus]
ALLNNTFLRITNEWQRIVLMGKVGCSYAWEPEFNLLETHITCTNFSCVSTVRLGPMHAHTPALT